MDRTKDVANRELKFHYQMTITRYIYQGGQQTIFTITSVELVLVTEKKIGSITYQRKRCLPRTDVTEILLPCNTRIMRDPAGSGKPGKSVVC